MQTKDARMLVHVCIYMCIYSHVCARMWCIYVWIYVCVCCVRVCVYVLCIYVRVLACICANGIVECWVYRFSKCRNRY